MKNNTDTKVESGTQEDIEILFNNFKEFLKEEYPDVKIDIELLFNNFKAFLKEKNIRYGDSAIKPVHIFSDLSAQSQLCNRADDKISRIKNCNELKKNDVADLFGYIALIMIEKGWLEFDELLD